MLLGQLDLARSCLESTLTFENTHNAGQQTQSLGRTHYQLARVHRALGERAALWAALALASVKDLPEPAVQAGKRAREFLKNSEPGVSTESLLLHALLAKVDGDQQRLQNLVEDLLKLQQDDGGWSWLREGAPSDSLTTGEVLYGLSTLGRDRADASVMALSNEV